MKVVKQFYSLGNFRHFRIAQNTPWMTICKVLHKQADIQEKVIENKVMQNFGRHTKWIMGDAKMANELQLNW